MSNISAQYKVSFDWNENKFKSIDLNFYSDSSDKSIKTKIENTLFNYSQEKIANLIKDKIITSNSPTYVQILDNKRVQLISDIGLPSQKVLDISDEIKISDENKYLISAKKTKKIKKHCLFILNKTKPKYETETSKVDKSQNSNPIILNDKSILQKAFQNLLKGLDFIFVQKLIHAKSADIAVLGLFAFTILATALTIFAPHLSILHFAKLAASVSHPIFGGLNITVGMAIFVQAYKNLMKAKKNENREEMILAIVSMLFSFAIMATGFAAIANFSNDIFLKSLFTICASFSFGVGIYNTIKTQLFRKKLNNAENLKEFLKEQLQISIKEYEILKEKIANIHDIIEIEKLLKKYLSNEEYLKALKEDQDFKKALLFNLELQRLQRKKIANVEKILRSKITKRALDYITESKVQDKDLEADIKKELNHRNIADALRIVATSLSIGAFGFNTLSKIESINLQNLIYYSTMMVSKLSGFWQNYVPSWRNVPADDKINLKIRKTILENMYKKADPTILLQAQ